MGNEEPPSKKSGAKKDKVSLPKVKSGVKGGLGKRAYIDVDELRLRLLSLRKREKSN
jgi:hypothetical protein